MVVSLNFLLGTGPESVLSVIGKQGENAQAEKTLEQLKTKLETLKNIDKAGETEKLKGLLAAMPPAKKVWFLIEALDRSASGSGIQINEFSGTIGNVKEATGSATTSAQITTPEAANIMGLKVDYKAAPFENFAQAIGEMENFIPMVKVAKVSFDTTKTSISVEGAWGQLNKPQGNIDNPIPDYQTIVNKAYTDIQGMQDLSGGGN